MCKTVTVRPVFTVLVNTEREKACDTLSTVPGITQGFVARIYY